jgi:hypothetical protein|tara:strand:+ start:2578 stop:3045 length:468 start_codon:yes stop_codon:yes gene_type:complete
MKLIGCLVILYIARYTNLPAPIETVHTVYIGTETEIRVTPVVLDIPAVPPVKDGYQGLDSNGDYRGWASDEAWQEFLETPKGIEYTKKHITGLPVVKGAPEVKTVLSKIELCPDTTTVIKTVPKKKARKDRRQSSISIKDRRGHAAMIEASLGEN